MSTVQVVKTHHNDIETIKGSVNKAEAAIGEMKEEQTTFTSRVNQMEMYLFKTYSMTCENKQWSTKGNFIWRVNIFQDTFMGRI